MTVILLFIAIAGSASEIGIWGNQAKAWQNIFSDTEIMPGKRPPVSELGKYRIAILSSVAEKNTFTSEEVAALKEYCRNGGILLIDYSTITMFGSDKGIYDLSAGEEIMGANRYAYNEFKGQATELAGSIFGEKAGILNNFPAGRGPALGGPTSVKVLQSGGNNVVLLGVNRCGKGAFIYSARKINAENKEFNEMILTLLGKLKDKAFLDKYFPLPLNNQAALCGGKRVHLAIGGSKYPAAGNFLSEKLAAITGKKDFSASAEHSGQLTIHVGRTNDVEKLNLDFDNLPKYGYFMVKTDDGAIVLAGNSIQADKYAVNDFLKRYAGYRKFSDSPLTEIVPAREFIELPEKFSFREVPDIPSYTVVWVPNGDFGRNSRLTAMSTHSMNHLIPPEKYAAEHPDWYSEIDGKRVTFAKGKLTLWQPCLANPELPRLVLEYADRYFKEKPDNITLPLGVNDGLGDCHCTHCKELERKYINQYADFYNQAARALKTRYPDKLIGFIAYGAAKKVPKNITMEPNILVEVCNMGSNVFDEYGKWQDIGIKHFGLYDYFYTLGGGYVVPRYYPHWVAESWKKEFKRFPMTSMWLEFYPRTRIFELPRQYVLDELAWNHNADVEALLNDYFSSMYGSASVPVRLFFDRLEEVFCRTAPIYAIADWKNMIQMDGYTMEDIAYLNAKLAETKKLVPPDSVYAKRLATLDKAWQLSRLYIETYICGTNIKKGEKIIESAVRGYELIDAINNFTMTPEEENEIFVSKATLKQFRTEQSYLNPLPRLEKYVDQAFDAITKSELKNNSKEQMAQYWRAMTSKSTSENFRKAVLTQAWQLENPSVNLVSIPGFELNEKVNADNEKQIEKPADWEEFKGVKGWSTWHFPSSVSRFYHDRREARSGEYSGSIGENQVGGSLICYVKLEPGCRYRLAYYVKRNDENNGMYGSLSVRMQGKGKWLDNGSAIVSPYPAECVGKWIEVGTTFSAPAEDATALLLFGAPVQGAGSMVWFDDISLVKIYDPSTDNDKVKKQP